jgi:hypothetical protein
MLSYASIQMVFHILKHGNMYKIPNHSSSIISINNKFYGIVHSSINNSKNVIYPSLNIILFKEINKLSKIYVRNVFTEIISIIAT